MNTNENYYIYLSSELHRCKEEYHMARIQQNKTSIALIIWEEMVWNTDFYTDINQIMSTCMPRAVIYGASVCTKTVNQ